MINTINADVHAAEQALDAALAAHQAIPARLPLAQVHPGQQVLDTETKLIHHAIRIAAFNTAQSLARAIVTATGYTRADDEAHTLIRTALAGSGDIIPDGDTLHIRLDPLPAPRHTAAIDELCHALNDTHTVYPGTDLTLRYSTKPHRRPQPFLSYVRSPGDRMSGKVEPLACDLVLVGTGYEPGVPRLIRYLAERVGIADLQVSRRYRLDLGRSAYCAVYLQGVDEQTLGIADSLISVLAHRFQDIVYDLLDRRDTVRARTA